MSDRWTDRLSEYLDGELAADEARELEAHLEACAECREILGDLRRIVDGAASLRDAEPKTDLWAGIAERICEAEEPPEIRVVSLFDAKRARRRVSFSVPQLLAASIVLAVMSAGSVWVALRGTVAGGTLGPVAVAPVEVTRAAPAGAAPAPAGGEAAAAETASAAEQEGMLGSGMGVPSAREAGRPAPGQPARALPRGETSARLVGFSDPAYDAAVADLQAVLDQGRDRLDPRTVAVLEESLSTIDAAIADARAALEADPANAQLNTYLAGTMQRKLELLREASQIVTATT